MITDEVQKKSGKRLKIIEGQVRGVQKMLSEKKECLDILMQISAIHEALRGVGKVIVRNHLETCVTDGIRGKTAEKQYDELMEIIYKLSK